ncbi:nucleoside deaminase [Pontibaca methylaminivorans]|uniref:tRNA(Arg) A34 adenosine deaminase TadA n=1 Tax=Pontibaca methylaminivorans TaxID=515897 RepID=A0A1R3X972_9RHOB|nr:nucleoside deaminase [Pontibaca methylaminivorans]SIT86830.1 tRNA(Arg) A34 adenosine deaminase TadA [Pontibaca methylaminivorans]
MNDDGPDHLGEAIALAEGNVRTGGRPFGAVLVRDGVVLGAAVNEAHLSGDPTDHAELLAIRRAVRDYGVAALAGATIHASGQPCPMCLGACHAVGIARVVFAGSNAEGAPHGLSSQSALERICRLLGPESGSPEPECEPGMRVEHKPRPDRIAALYRDWVGRAQG